MLIDSLSRKIYKLNWTSHVRLAERIRWSVRERPWGHIYSIGGGLYIHTIEKHIATSKYIYLFGCDEAWNTSRSGVVLPWDNETRGLQFRMPSLHATKWIYVIFVWRNGPVVMPGAMHFIMGRKVLRSCIIHYIRMYEGCSKNKVTL